MLVATPNSLFYYTIKQFVVGIPACVIIRVNRCAVCEKSSPSPAFYFLCLIIACGMLFYVHVGEFESAF